jgi:chromate transporter
LPGLIPAAKPAAVAVEQIDAAGRRIDPHLTALGRPPRGTFFLALAAAVGDERGMDAIARKPIVGALDRAGLREAFAVWMQVSIAGIGGAALQLATMHRILVRERRWISEERFFHALSYCIALPGPETQQLAIYIGWLVHRRIGGIIAGSLFILPGAICMMALCFGYVTGADSSFGHAMFLGVRPAILAVMADAILRFGSHVLHSKWMGALAAVAFIAAFLKVAFPIIILAAAAVGICIALAGLPGLARPSADAPDALAASDENSALLAQPRTSLRRFATALAAGLALWLAPPAVLLATLGLHSIYTQISLLMGKVALMALGGDYAVVAYAAEQGIHAHHWLSGSQMQEGIAMGEMVPGTIIIVTQFVGFIAAFRDSGALPPLLAGTIGGLLATWMTFCPCFLFIMLVAPFIEGLRRNALLNNTLQAVTAAAVGMILNLSVWFGLRTLFDEIERLHYAPFRFDLPVLASVNPWAVALFAFAAIAVLRFRVSAVTTLLASSAAGVVMLLLGLTR